MDTGRLIERARNRTLRLRQRPWRMAAHRSPEPHIVMGGAPRSGTTVLRKVFDRHPQIVAGPETKLFVPAAFNLEWLASAYEIPLSRLDEMRRRSASQAAFIDAFAARVRADAGKSRWAEKTPQNIRNLDWIMARFPEASIVHIIRDGRDVVCSMRHHPDWRWLDGGWQKVLVPRSVASYARRWLADTAAGMAWREDPRYVEVRYEDLVSDPAAVLRSLCLATGAALDRDWLDAVTRREAAAQHEIAGSGSASVPSTSAPGSATAASSTSTFGPVPVPGSAERKHGPGEDSSGRTGPEPDYEGALSSASVGRWRAELSPAELDEIERLCAERLRALGYEG
jgi:protein-tyrosine sulfotransferase